MEVHFDSGYIIIWLKSYEKSNESWTNNVLKYVLLWFFIYEYY